MRFEALTSWRQDKGLRDRQPSCAQVTKKVMIRGLNVEIEKLQGQLQAAKEKSGVRLAYSEYMELQARCGVVEGQKREMTAAVADAVYCR